MRERATSSAYKSLCVSKITLIFDRPVLRDGDEGVLVRVLEVCGTSARQLVLPSQLLKLPRTEADKVKEADQSTRQDGP